MQDSPHDHRAVRHQLRAFPAQGVHATEGVLVVLVGEAIQEGTLEQCADIGQVLSAQLCGVRHPYVGHGLNLASLTYGRLRERAVRELDPRRIWQRDAYADLLEAEGRTRLLEVGTGPGRDATAFLRRGLRVSGVDLSYENVAMCRAAGIDARVASLRLLPFEEHSFDAGWTMSTLLHVPDADFDAAMRELVRVLMPGAPLAIGLWGGHDFEGSKPDDAFHPPRFFSFRTHDRVQKMLALHGELEQFHTWSPSGSTSWSYQWCQLRLP
jgi:SAM-dependent methyltransferase